MQVAMEEALTVNFTKRKHLRKEQQKKIEVLWLHSHKSGL